MKQLSSYVISMFQLLVTIHFLAFISQRSRIIIISTSAHKRINMLRNCIMTRIRTIELFSVIRRRLLARIDVPDVPVGLAAVAPVTSRKLANLILPHL